MSGWVRFGQTSGRFGKWFGTSCRMRSSSPLKEAGSRSGQYQRMGSWRYQSATPASALPRSIRRRCSRSSARWGLRRRRRMGPGWGSPCAGSSSNSTAEGSGSRVSWAWARRSRSRSRCAVANELILVVEDNDKNRKLVRDVLTFKGYEIIEAETGEECGRLAQERHPRLVLMDIRLPGIDGIEALRRLRAEQATRGIPIMAMTASVMTEDRRRITDAGFDAYQSKPLKVKDFVAAVERLLDHPGK